MSGTPDPKASSRLAASAPRAGPAVLIIAIVAFVGAAGSAHAVQSGPGWRWPLTPRPVVLRGFAPPAHRWLAGHRGVDLAGHSGQPVLAAGAGTVTFASVLAGRGVLVVGHGALRTTYEPVQATAPVGTVVRAGDVIGRLDATGGHCLAVSPCLHWGVLRGRAYLDPLALVWGGHVRLLPLSRAPAPSADADLGAAGSAGSADSVAAGQRSSTVGQAGYRAGVGRAGSLVGPGALALAALGVRRLADRVGRRWRAPAR